MTQDKREFAFLQLCLLVNSRKKLLSDDEMFTVFNKAGILHTLEELLAGCKDSNPKIWEQVRAWIHFLTVLFTN